jgi:hypothetical protein
MRNPPGDRPTGIGSRRSSTAASAAAVAFLVVLSAALGTLAVITGDRLVPERTVANRPIQISEDGYATSQTCKACHPSEYETWHGSYHRTMTQVATPATVVADFNDAIVDAVRGRAMNLEHRGTELWAEFDDPDWEGGPGGAPRITRQVVLITGSHRQQIYWYPTGNGRTLGHLPSIYLIAERQWIPRRTAVMHPPEQLFSETGSWNGVCVACHTTLGKPGFDTPFRSQPIQTQTVDTRAAEFGISCESCHGPGEAHERLNRNPARRYWFHLSGRPDPTTVQPLRLDPQRSSQVCGQCHSVWEFYDSEGERQANVRGLPYRPGDDLTQTRFLAQPARSLDSSALNVILSDDPDFVKDSFWSDGMVRVTGREYNGMIESPCYRKATDDRRMLSCFSCHVLHKPVDDPRPIPDWADAQLKSGMDGNAACLQCHASLGTNLSSHTKHAAGSPGSSCYNCHMPYTTYGLLKTIRSHQISSPSVAASLQTGRPNACNLCHLDRTLAWTAGQP